MINKHLACILLALAALGASILACSPPIPRATLADATPYVPTTPSPQETRQPSSTDTPEATTEDTPPPTLTDTPSPTATDTPPPAPTDTPLPTATHTPPPAPTIAPEPTATPTEMPSVEPLVIVDRGYEIVDWQPLPSKEWEGHLRITFRGGLPPYTSSIGHREPQAENLHYFRYAACKGASVRADVWSADGQHANRDIWVEAPWCPTPAP